jgi:hypothetical protein
MFVKVGDTLQFSGLQIVTKKSVITENDITKQLYVVSLEAKVNLLDEVEIKQYKNINAVSLGILQRPAKVYTPAERRLKTASDYDVTDFLGPTIGFSMGLDPILNAISGRTAMLKKELKIEKKEYLLNKIEYMFKEEYFLENLKIPKEYIVLLSVLRTPVMEVIHLLRPVTTEDGFIAIIMRFGSTRTIPTSCTSEQMVGFIIL